MGGSAIKNTAEVVPMKEEREGWWARSVTSHSRQKEHMADKQKSGRVSLTKTKRRYRILQ